MCGLRHEDVDEMCVHVSVCQRETGVGLNHSAACSPVAVDLTILDSQKYESAVDIS